MNFPFISLLLFNAVQLSVQLREFNFENVQQINGTDVAEFKVRVSKFNRTTSVVKGTIDIKRALGEDFKFNVDMLHSPKGNNQFNYYPMKIPQKDFCTFTKETWPDYVQFFEPAMPNVFAVNDCPITPRTIEVNNLIARKEMMTQYAPSGLWRIVLHCYNSAGEGFSVVFTMKLLQDGYF